MVRFASDSVYTGFRKSRECSHQVPSNSNTSDRTARPDGDNSDRDSDKDNTVRDNSMRPRFVVG